jgi:hypothetical protein
MKSFLIGSLPFTDKLEALSFIAKIDIPTLCTLPQLDEKEFMLHHAFLGLKNFAYVRNRIHYTKTNEMVAPFHFQLEEDFFNTFTGEYKWQVTGPVTMIETMEMHENDKELLEQYIEKIILTQRKFNQLNNSASFLFLDEPMLGGASELSSILVQFIQKLKGSGEFSNTTFGMHSCSKLDFDLTQIPVDLFALDYTLYEPDEWNDLQASLTDKLVAIVADSDGKKINYPLMSEQYQSTTCGQALAKNMLSKIF